MSVRPLGLALALLLVGAPTIRAQPLATDPTTAQPEPPTGPLVTLSVQRAPLHDVLDGLARQTGIAFLYRDGLVAGHRVSLTVAAAPLDSALRLALRGTGIGFTRSERQVLLHAGSTARSDGGGSVGPIRISGFVIDAASGERLPYATLATADGRTGAVSNAAGFYQLTLPEPGVWLVASSLGYTATSVELPIGAEGALLDIRLTPTPFALGTVEVVDSLANGSPGGAVTVDGSWQAAVVHPGGEASPLRDLSLLPSVGLATDFARGLRLRGSAPGATAVTLDGIPIYNPSHLLGVADSFTPDALQIARALPGIAPVAYDGRLGGTVELVTRTGDQRQFRVQSNVSPLATSTTIEGPIAGGRGAWLASGRGTLPGIGNTLGTDDLLRYGITQSLRMNSLRTSTTPLPDVSFYDLHGKGSWEFPSGDQLLVSGYLGRDRVAQTVIAPPREELDDRWGNGAASLRWQHLLSPTAFVRTLVAGSRYQTDYTHTQLFRGRRGAGAELRTLETFNRVDEGLVRSDLNWLPRADHDISLGFAAESFGIRYGGTDQLTAKLDRSRTSRTTVGTTVFSLYAEDGWRPIRPLTVRTGLRVATGTSGGFTRFSPRLLVTLSATRATDLWTGVGRTVQWMNQVSNQELQWIDLWVPAVSGQPPATSWQAVVGGRTRLGPVGAQLEGYDKRMQHLRRDDWDAQVLLFDPTQGRGEVEAAPWFSDGEGTARGIEAQLDGSAGPVTLYGGYTLSRTELTYPGPREAPGTTQRFPAPWDRRHQASFVAALRPLRMLTLGSTLVLATGTPDVVYGNGLITQGRPSTTQRAPGYGRLDLSATATGRLGKARGPVWQLTLGVSNVTNRQNVGYRVAYQVERPANPGAGNGRMVPQISNTFLLPRTPVAALHILF